MQSLISTLTLYITKLNFSKSQYLTTLETELEAKVQKIGLNAMLVIAESSYLRSEISLAVEDSHIYLLCVSLP